MNTLILLQAILNLLPTGITLTQEILNLFNHTTTAINAEPGSLEHTTSVQAILNTSSLNKNGNSINQETTQGSVTKVRK